MGVEAGLNVAKARPLGLVVLCVDGPGGCKKQIDQETNEASWPEMGALLRRETNLSSDYLLAMFFSGVVAAAGLTPCTSSWARW